jgi:hypothetical protein
MMRWILLILLFVAAPAHAQMLLSGAGPAPPTCPVGTPSPDGSTILPVGVGQTSCVLADSSGNQLEFQGNIVFFSTGGAFTAFGIRAQVQINSGGKAYIASTCPTPGYTLWLAYIGNQLVTSPTVALANQFFDNTRSLSFNNLNDMISSGSVLAGDAMEVKPLPGGLPIYFTAGAIFKSNQTFTLDAGSVMGCTSSEGAAIMTVDTGGGPVSNITVQAGGGSPMPELAYAQDFGSGGLRGILIGQANGFTIDGLYIHDNDFGVQSGNGTGVNGTVTITNSLFIHNGSSAPGQGAATHNFYIGDAPQTLNVTNTRSYCVGNTNSTTAGFEAKDRTPNGTWTNDVFAEVDPVTGHTDCLDSGAIDFPCGGIKTLGGTTAGTGIVAQLGPNSENTALMRVADDFAGGNCPGSTPWPTTIVVQRAWLLLDLAGTPVVALNAQALSVTVKNSNIVCNTTQICDAAHALGTNVTDGGGNVFNTRAGFGLGACTSLSSCPLPTVM